MGTQLELSPSIVAELSDGHLERQRQSDSQTDRQDKFKSDDESNYSKLTAYLLDPWWVKLAWREKFPETCHHLHTLMWVTMPLIFIHTHTHTHTQKCMVIFFTEWGTFFWAITPQLKSSTSHAVQNRCSHTLTYDYSELVDCVFHYPEFNQKRHTNYKYMFMAKHPCYQDSE